MIKLITYIIFVFVVFCTPALSGQDIDGQALKLEYYEDFSSYKSFPSMCVDDIFEDSSGKLWFRTCGGALELSAFLYSFNGYEFDLVKGQISELGKSITIMGVVGDKLYGSENLEDGHKLFNYNLLTEEYVVYDSTHNSIQVVQNFKSDTIYTYVEYADRFEMFIKSEINSQHFKTSKRKSCHLSEFRSAPFFMGNEVWTWNDQKELFCKVHFTSLQEKEFTVDAIIDELPVGKYKEIGKELLFFRNYLSKYELPNNTKASLFLRFLNNENPIRFKTPSSQETLFAIFKDEKGQLLCLEETSIKRKASLFLNNNEQLDLTSFFSNVNYKGVRKILSEDFLSELHICKQDGFSLLKINKNDAFQTIPLAFSTRALTELSDSLILINIAHSRPWLYDLSTKKLSLFNGLGCDIISSHFVKRIENEYWSTSNSDLIRYDAVNGTCQSYPVGAKGIRIFEILDNSKILYVSTDRVLNILDISTSTFMPLLIGGQEIRLKSPALDLFIDSQGLIWLTTADGLFQIDIPNQKIQNYNELITNFNFRFLCIEQDQEGKLWLGTSLSGLVILDPQTLEFIQLNSSNGLCNNTVATITRDKMNSYWLGTFNGVALVSNKGELISNFYKEDGIVHNECNRHSASLLSDDRIAIGSVHGFTILDPMIVNRNFTKDSTLKVYLTEVSYFDEKLGNPVSEKQSLSTLKQIILPAHNKNFQLRFATSNYIKPLENKYSYRFGKSEWIDIGTENELDFKQLPSGKHKLQIRGSDNKGNWSKNDIELEVIVKRIFYKNPWFYLFVGLCILGLGFIWIYSLKGQVDRATKQIKADKEVIEKQAEKLKELDEAKGRFFTNISHEFRTPLTIIKGMAQQIKEKPNDLLESGTKMIGRNTEDLLNLVNQIMDLRKLESNELKLNMIQADVIHHIKLIAESYTNLASQKGINLDFIGREPSIMMDFDPEKLLRIVSNLLSNAIKFTKSGGDIFIRVERLDIDNSSKLKIQVEDTGVGMEQESLPSIFDRFYQEKSVSESEKGTGIGLALTKALVDLMGGKIEVSSKLWEGSVFTVFLAISQVAMKRASDNNPVQLIKVNTEVGIPRPLSVPNIFGDKPSVLIVEDNIDLQQYFVSLLEDYYHIDLANNGLIGVEKAIKRIPDLILSDVMMPEMDGFELTNRLKNDVRTDHIPIIILTAKDDIDSKISGLSKGADAYLAKPFEKQELLVRIEKLLQLRNKLQERYTNQDSESEERIVIEDPFLHKLHQFIQNQMGDTNLTMDKITREMAMSRTQVFRKLKALTGLSPTLFIRSIRLKRSKELLKTTTMNVSEVAYEVGFASLSYFSTAFMEEYGVRPSEYRK